MKKIILGIAMMMAGVAFSNAQNQNTAVCDQQGVCTATEQAQCNVKDQCKENCPFQGLNLTTEQQEKIKDLNNALEASKKELKQEANTEKKDMNAKRKELRQKYVDDLEKILSTDQFMSYLKNYYVNGGNNGPKIQRADRGRLGKAAKADKKIVRAQKVQTTQN